MARHVATRAGDNWHGFVSSTAGRLWPWLASHILFQLRGRRAEFRPGHFPAAVLDGIVFRGQRRLRLASVGKGWFKMNYVRHICIDLSRFKPVDIDKRRLKFPNNLITAQFYL